MTPLHRIEVSAKYIDPETNERTQKGYRYLIDLEKDPVLIDMVQEAIDRVKNPTNEEIEAGSTPLTILMRHITEEHPTLGNDAFIKRPYIMLPNNQRMLNLDFDDDDINENSETEHKFLTAIRRDLNEIKTLGDILSIGGVCYEQAIFYSICLDNIPNPDGSIGIPNQVLQIGTNTPDETSHALVVCNYNGSVYFIDPRVPFIGNENQITQLYQEIFNGFSYEVTIKTKQVVLP